RPDACPAHLPMPHSHLAPHRLVAPASHLFPSFLVMPPPPPRSPLFPYTTLFRSASAVVLARSASGKTGSNDPARGRHCAADAGKDRKSTRLNSSHVSISYAVFCLKKKTYAPEAAQQPQTKSAPASSSPLNATEHR